MPCSWRFAVVAIGGLLFSALRASGQSNSLNLTGSSNCTPADLDAYLGFINGPGDYYSVVIDQRNISTHPCNFDGPDYGPSFVPDRVSDGAAPVKLCYNCEDTRQLAAPTINPGQVVRQIFRWKTKPQSQTARCLSPKWMSGPVLLVAPSLLKQICFSVEVSRFNLVEPPHPSFVADEPGDSGQGPEFQLTSGRNRYYAGQRFPLHLALSHSNPESVSTGESCPTLYLRERSPDGATRIDELQPASIKGCPGHDTGHPLADWESGLEFDSGANTRWSGFGEHAMQVYQLRGSPDDDQFRFISSNVLRIQLADPAALVRKWGPLVKGVAADITLDKDTFRLGEDIPLHLAIENFNAEVPIYSWDPLWDPCFVVGIRVQDAAGKSLPESQRFPDSSICMGHGRGPRLYPRGEIVTMEWSLAAKGWLPNHLGTYSVVLSWCPLTSSTADVTAQYPFTIDGLPTSLGNQPKGTQPYTVVHATAVIHIVGNDISQ